METDINMALLGAVIKVEATPLVAVGMPIPLEGDICITFISECDSVVLGFVLPIFCSKVGSVLTRA